MGTPESFHLWPYTTSSRPCAYCCRSWTEAKRKHKWLQDGYTSSNYLQKVGQFNAATKKTIWTWLCPSCKELLEEQVAKPVSDYMLTPEEIAAATIRLVIQEEQQEKEALTKAA